MSQYQTIYVSITPSNRFPNTKWLHTTSATHPWISTVLPTSSTSMIYIEKGDEISGWAGDDTDNSVYMPSTMITSTTTSSTTTMSLQRTMIHTVRRNHTDNEIAQFGSVSLTCEYGWTIPWRWWRWWCMWHLMEQRSGIQQQRWCWVSSRSDTSTTEINSKDTYILTNLSPQCRHTDLVKRERKWTRTSLGPFL